MGQITVQQTVAIGGVTISRQQSRNAPVGIGYETPATDPILPGKAGTLTTRNDDNTGVVTLSNGHGITTSQKVDLFWSGGVRAGMGATVSGNAVTLDGGVGDVLPAETTAVVACVPRVVPLAFGGDALKTLLASNNTRAHVDFQDDAGASLLPLPLAAGEGYGWVSDSNVDNPLASDAVAAFAVSNGNSSTNLLFKLGVLYGTGA